MASAVEKKRQREQKVVGQMIAIYCHGVHHTPTGQLCPQCQALNNYAMERSDKCPFMQEKTFCSNCKVHCYRGDMATQIRQVMRYAGPRMLLHHPVMAIRHVWESAKEKRQQNRR
ncbi:nitrous oxide-stimulated promoter family protein [Pseudoflavonifractor sp. An85]|uniref:nitrous oxide-stimulated promoter family protein n=1 Tax=Pseudoflavonifractor sp. An85 TaxID=1965661 RepID=UPI000B371B7D|nr:nitrous oxide-stimulated promoter family protein [Pseudoflavonifractor sp. An85]OUN25403.1 hypothetical protein B5G37_04120 [Pseudoflavonifractor sp. An85]